MQYRTFPGLDWKPSALGFGAMRLPVIDRDPSRVDIPEATRMIRYAIDHGVNYLDTAYFYHGGNAEPAVAEALKDGYREKIKLATKFPAWEVKSRADFDEAFERQLARLQTDKVDFYLLHGLHRPIWENLQDMGILPWLEGWGERASLSLSPMPRRAPLTNTRTSTTRFFLSSRPRYTGTHRGRGRGRRAVTGGGHRTLPAARTSMEKGSDVTPRTAASVFFL